MDRLCEQGWPCRYNAKEVNVMNIMMGVTFFFLKLLMCILHGVGRARQCRDFSAG